MTNYNTLKLTDNQIEALLRAIYIHNLSYDGEEDLEGTPVPEAMRSLEQIETKIAKLGWEV